MATTLDLLEYEQEINDVEPHEPEQLSDCASFVQRELRRDSSREELFVVRGETTGTSRSARIPIPKRRPQSATSTSTSQSNQQSHAKTDLERAVYEEKFNALRTELADIQRELEHTRDERDEVQQAFRRLDQEIASGYNLTERKEKELKIAELTAKNVKLSQMLEKELKTQAALRGSNADLQKQLQQCQDRLILVNQVLSSVESKNASLEEANNQLVLNYATIQQRLEAVQLELVDLQTKSLGSTADSAQLSASYEEKRGVLERRVVESQRRLDDKCQQLRAEQEKIKGLELKLEKKDDENARLDGEIHQLQDELIQLNATMKTMEARIEAASKTPAGASTVERMTRRIRVLEEELLLKNRQLESLKETMDSLLHGDTHHTLGSSRSLASRPSHSGGKRPPATANKMLYLTDKLRRAEEARDHKARCLHVLLDILPHLLQRLDTFQDRVYAAEETNAILSDAVNQLQSPPEDTALTCEGAIALSREQYLLSGPYQPDLLMGFTVHHAFNDDNLDPPRKKRSSPQFQVRSVTRTSYGQDAKAQTKTELMLTADADDSNGVVFLNRIKINAFLQVIQCKATQAKAKHLLIQKIADVLSSYRDLQAQHSSDTAFFKASRSVLTKEVHQLKKQVDSLQQAMQKMLTETSQLPRTPQKLLLKYVAAVVGSSSTKVSTFVTQSDPLDALLVESRFARMPEQSPSGIHLRLDDCGLNDDDLEPLLLNLSVSHAGVRELNLDGNDISDAGIATLAAFVETANGNLEQVSLRCCHAVTADGVAHLRSSLLKNPWIHRVDVDTTTYSLVATSTEIEYDTAGRPLHALRILLPESAFSSDNATLVEQDDAAHKIIQELERRGFHHSAANMTRAQSAYQRAQSPTTKYRQSRLRAASSTIPFKKPQTRTVRIAQQEKLRSLEAALRRADSTGTSSETGQRGITLAQMQHLLKGAACGASATSHRMKKLQFAQSHLATIRGLGKR